MRFIKDDRHRTTVPVERPDGTRRDVFGGTAPTGSRDIRCECGAWMVDLAVDHAYGDEGDCGGFDVRSRRFVVR